MYFLKVISSFTGKDCFIHINIANKFLVVLYHSGYSFTAVRNNPTISVEYNKSLFFAHTGKFTGGELSVQRRGRRRREKGKEREKKMRRRSCLNVCLYVQVYPKRGRVGTLMRDHDAAGSLDFFLIMCDLSPFLFPDLHYLGNHFIF